LYIATGIVTQDLFKDLFKDKDYVERYITPVSSNARSEVSPCYTVKKNILYLC